jgi:hypothetical protein
MSSGSDQNLKIPEPAAFSWQIQIDKESRINLLKRNANQM